MALPESYYIYNTILSFLSHTPAEPPVHDTGVADNLCNGSEWYLERRTGRAVLDTHRLSVRIKA